MFFTVVTINYSFWEKNNFDFFRYFTPINIPPGAMDLVSSTCTHCRYCFIGINKESYLGTEVTKPFFNNATMLL
jgi:hypothetical protein